MMGGYGRTLLVYNLARMANIHKMMEVCICKR